ncbi:sialate O-acetylesterase [Ravibacter arvi]|uniref:Sialate O-acetylesterase n=1 Tax=Ravibacter arvi TaxID=2051041 RepID=A0ABP8MAT8_9BACT
MNIVLIISVLMTVFSASESRPPRKKMDLYLLIGQSNMAGRGKLDSAAVLEREGIWVIQADNSWTAAKDPVHYDKPKMVGIGPGLAFAEEIRKASGRPIGLIPCAVGGSRLDDWATGRRHEQTGIYAYDAMLARVKEAQKRGRLKGILWHQGEGDSTPELAAVYGQKLSAFFERLRKDIGAEKVPVLIGTLGDFYVRKNPRAADINKIIEGFPVPGDHIYVVSSSGLTDLGDGTHFDGPSARELGRRYAEQYLKIK